MSIDFASYLTQKYANQRLAAEASANLQNTQAALMPADQAARNAAQKTQADAAWMSATGSHDLSEANASHITALTPAQVGLTQAQTGLTGAQTTGINLDNAPATRDAVAAAYRRMGFQIDFTPRSTPATQAAAPATGGLAASASGSLGAPTSLSVLDTDALDAARKQRATQLGYAKGTSKVPGKGSGKVDTVPTMLAPGEAVLNKGAAEHFGRDNIKALNAVGLLHMGMPPSTDNRAKQPQGKPAPKGTKDDRAPKSAAPGKEAPKSTKDNRVPPKVDKGKSEANLAKGTSHVGKGPKHGDTPKLDPKMLQAVMGMLGGGMPQPQPQGQPQQPVGGAGMI